jgi:YVTN family beta-propeller protein
MSQVLVRSTDVTTRKENDMRLKIYSWPLALALGLLGLGCGSSADKPSTEPIPAVTADAIYVVNGGSNSISVIDAASSSVLGTIAIKNAMFPHHIYMSRDRSTLLVAVPGMDLSQGHDVDPSGVMGAVLLLDAATGKTLASTNLDAMNHNAIFSPDGSEVWTSQMMMPGSVLVLDGKTLQTKQTIAVGDMPAEITFSLDGKYAFVANSMSNNVTVIDPATKKVLKTIPVGKGPVGPWPGVDGVMYTDCEKDQSISAIDSQMLSVVRTYQLGFMPGMVATPPGGSGELWITDEDDGKLVFNQQSMDKKTGELVTGAGAHGIAFSADGKTAYVTNQMADTVSVVDVASHRSKGTIHVGNKPNGLLFRAR